MKSQPKNQQLHHPENLKAHTDLTNFGLKTKPNASSIQNTAVRHSL
jgi:hypothetical protein